MLEIPESSVLSTQISEVLRNKKIIGVISNHSPHKFAWFHGDPNEYNKILVDKTIHKATPYGGMIEIKVESSILLFADGVSLKYNAPNEKLPPKHQLLLKFEDSSSVTASVQMYGGIWCFNENSDFKNPYYDIAKDKPSPLCDEFDKNYFFKLINSPDIQKLSTKSFLATEQRIPGLGNGVLQDILWQSKLHPKRKINSLATGDKELLFINIKKVLLEMVELNGRDTEKDLFGNNGGYKTRMSKNTVGSSCPSCDEIIEKANYLGGSIYFCPNCQKL
ncbi:formamidopyrimidine-DNA glycosylase [Clostridium cellulovorans]|uniref:DNA glycosylase/AP lyase, H2TH DNA-binding n=1 Tax=Clostridium cellulovorans (strain ATCC 35296 / DSM 3052 / OCM 3 / 743B) TaxID=573061 RepID=D9SMC2_CLOC7|nr:formamidopyrimidine-DNA glycosylase [Clostridium cellulovorans]ADL53778.1 DNA glycosylase/AP lyase, H2TH DNA-binding [Clostridium cellulovorans 743B]